MQRTCYFFGTDNIQSVKTAYTKVYALIERLVTKEKVTVFIFGTLTLFDSVSCCAAVKIKERYPHTEIRIYSGNNEHILKNCTHITAYNYNDVLSRDKIKEIKKENKNIKIYYLVS